MAAITGDPAVVDETVAAGEVDVEIAGRRHAARVSARPFYDPEGRRLRGG
jgi:glycine cleavage system aminomethyltransferase T